ncbi:MAG: thymidine phosphorylase [Kiritimatiellae bacterium]|nr:thymidine phosphorylase [Kiritimatiellia bacterium]
MITQWLIEKKRDGAVLSDQEIREFIAGYNNGSIPDYQMAALAMAIFFQGMTAAETAALTDAMMRSGDQISFDGWSRPVADKHSTGGIGDKLSLVIAPLAAAAGLAVPKISGRGLGITGGTLDKLESIPGYDTCLSIAEFKRVVEVVGCSIIGQTESLAPADKKLYALRDVTGTVPSIPLITASIMSKKLAAGAATLVFDVKCGRAAFMKSQQDAEALAKSLVTVGRALDRKCGAIITNMDQPLGRTAGNAVEVIEAIETLKGGGPPDTRLLAVELTAQMTVLSNVYPELDNAREKLAGLLENGAALACFRHMVEEQKGDARVIDDYTRFPQPGATVEIRAAAEGFVREVNAETIGRVVLQLGGGRRKTEDVIDRAAGVDSLAQQGQRVEKGGVLMRLHARSAELARSMVESAQAAVMISDTPPQERELIIALN